MSDNSTEYIDLDDLEYDDLVLRFLRKKLDDFTVDVFWKIARENKDHKKGLIKTKLDDYHNMRKKYDASFLILEAQGFIEKKEAGTATPYFVTPRGSQLIIFLLEEKKVKREELKYD